MDIIYIYICIICIFIYIHAHKRIYHPASRNEDIKGSHIDQTVVPPRRTSSLPLPPLALPHRSPSPPAFSRLSANGSTHCDGPSSLDNNIAFSPPPISDRRYRRRRRFPFAFYNHAKPPPPQSTAQSSLQQSRICRRWSDVWGGGSSDGRNFEIIRKVFEFFYLQRSRRQRSPNVVEAKRGVRGRVPILHGWLKRVLFDDCFHDIRRLKCRAL